MTNGKKIDIIVRQVTKRRPAMEKYSSGRRGAPAKGVGRVYRRESPNLSFSAIQVHNSNVVDLFHLIGFKQIDTI